MPHSCTIKVLNVIYKRSQWHFAASPPPPPVTAFATPLRRNIPHKWTLNRQLRTLTIFFRKPFWSKRVTDYPIFRVTRTPLVRANNMNHTREKNESVHTFIFMLLTVVCSDKNISNPTILCCKFGFVKLPYVHQLLVF